MTSLLLMSPTFVNFTQRKLPLVGLPMMQSDKPTKSYSEGYHVLRVTHSCPSLSVSPLNLQSPDQDVALSGDLTIGIRYGANHFDHYFENLHKGCKSGVAEYVVL